MGLDCSHDAFTGAYSSFDRFRRAVAYVIGGSWPPHEDPKLNDNEWYWGDNYCGETHPGLKIFFCHSDCDGELSPEECELVAHDLEELLPKLEKMGLGIKQTAAAGGYAAVARQFIAGCRAAAANNEPLTFD